VKWKRGDKQRLLHLLKRLLRLLKEAKHNALAELALLLIIIHLQDLLKRQGIDAVPQVWEADGAGLALQGKGVAAVVSFFIYVLVFGG